MQRDNSTITITLHHAVTVIIEIIGANKDHLAPRDVQALLVVWGLLVDQALQGSVVMMESQVMMVHREDKGLQALLEFV